jgi:lysophospholipase L1-like esterase
MTTHPALRNFTRRLQAGRPVKLVGFGDSITGIYYHTGGRQAWPEILGRLLRTICPQADITVVNAGVSGNTAAQALDRIERDVIAHRPDLVAVQLGMNDVVRTPPATFAENLRTIVTRLHAQGAEVLLMTPNAIDPADQHWPAAKVETYADIVRELAAELRVPLADTHDAFARQRQLGGPDWYRLLSDFIHPNFRGHTLIARTAAAVITGRDTAGLEPPPQLPALPCLQNRLQAAEPKLRVTAMTPYDRVLVAALPILRPGLQVEVNAWPAAGKTITDLTSEADAWGWPKYNAEPNLPPPDLMVIAPPANRTNLPEQAYYLAVSHLLNRTQSFSHLTWETLVIPLSAPEPAGAIARDKDLPALSGSSFATPELLSAALAAMLGAQTASNHAGR